MGLLSELRRRNVLRMAALYIVAAWLIMQVVEVVSGLAPLPDWVGPATLGVLAVGFPIALVLSWIYELTPEGISLEKDVRPGESITHLTGRRLDFIVIALLSAALLVFAWDKWGTPAPSEQSIAVLPFDAVGAQENGADVLAAGIQDGLLTRLSQIDSFRVISRTSVERYANNTISVGEIAAELGVRRIVEGGVQQIGDQIRVNVQLIDADTDEHIWAETYDRSLTVSDIFTIQSEIVESIADALDTTLTAEESEQLASMPTLSFDAYTEYLRGKHSADEETIESLHEAVDHFKTAIDLDPEFALAYVGLADAYLTLNENFLGGLPADEAAALAEPPLTRALMLDADSSEAQACLGLLRQVQGNFDAAVQAYETSIVLRPSYSRAYRFYGRLRWREGRRDEAMSLMQKALRLDPYSAPINLMVGRLHDEAGQFDDAMTHFLKVIEIEPDHAFAYVYVAAIHYLVHGRIDESIVWYGRAAENDAMSPSLQAAQALAYIEIGDPDNAKIWVDRASEIGPNTFWALWSNVALSKFIGDTEATQAAARRMLEHHPRNWGSLRFLRDADIAAGRFEVARARYARAYRELTEPEVPDVNVSNYAVAVDLALVLQLTGETDRADDLLDGGLEVMESLSRFGVNGFWLNDVRALTLKQQPELALERLREAVDDGWRFQVWYHMDLDPNLDSIRSTEEFIELNARLRADLEAQAQHVRDMKASGELAMTRPSTHW